MYREPGTCGLTDGNEFIHHPRLRFESKPSDEQFDAVPDNQILASQPTMAYRDERMRSLPLR